jgi:type I restriction enzyme S subunit
VKGIPASWLVKKFGEIANFTMGQSPKSEFYNESGDGLPFHQGVGTYGDRFPQKVTYCSVNGRKARQGDILFSVRAPVGRLNIADSEMIIGRGLAAIRHKVGHNSYLFYLLKVTFANEDIIGNGAIFNSVGKDELAKFQILQPDEPLARSFKRLLRVSTSKLRF